MRLEVVRTVMDRFPDPSRPNREIIQLLRIYLNNNDFIFDDNYLQVQGTAMGVGARDTTHSISDSETTS